MAVGARFKLSKSTLIYSFIFLLSACSQAPRHTLTQEEKQADLYWLFSQFGENYAPLNYKEKRFGFNFQDLKNKYLQDAETTKTNEEFYLLMHRFVSEFHDAHTSDMIPAATLPQRTYVAYLGFDGVRDHDELRVTKLLPTIAASSSYPIKIGDKISKLNGVSLKDIVTSEFIYYRNLGQDEANLTYHFPKIFNRTSVVEKIPSEDNAVLTVVRDSKDVQVTLPWIVKDLYHFSREQRQAVVDKGVEDTEESFGPLNELDFFKIAFQALNREIDVKPRIASAIQRTAANYNFTRSFEFFDNAPTWSSPQLAQILGDAVKKSKTPRDNLKEDRNVPSGAIFVEAAQTYPTYITRETILDREGKKTKKKKNIAYMYLNTFSPATAEDTVLKEVKDTLNALQALGVHDLVIDLINNGGGSLTLGSRLAQLLSNKPIDLPKLQFKLSETWLDEFETKSLSASSDTERELARRIFVGLVQDKDKRDLLSREWSVESLTPYKITPNDSLEENLNIMLLTNEMCASMCDIFTATLIDNKMAESVGSATMAAGGNVVSHREAPNSHLVVNQTESMIIRKDGSPIENNKIPATHEIKVVDTTSSKYDPVRELAVKLLATEK